MNNRSRLMWADVLKTGSIFSVILIHSAAPLLVQYDESQSENWWIGNLYNSLARWCIPVFFMISGAFLIEKAQKESLSQFFSRRFQRIFIPFIFWSGVYYLWRIYGNEEHLSLYRFPVLLLQEPIYYHLWFIYILIELYLLAPLIGMYVKCADLNNRLFFMTIWFVFGVVLPLMQSCCMFTTSFSIALPDSVINYIGYFFLGFMLRQYKAGRIMSIFLMVLFLSGFFLTAYGTFYMTVIRNSGVFVDFFYKYYNVNVMFMAIGIFILAKSPRILDRMNDIRRNRLVSVIASTVPGIYFIHALILAILKQGTLGITMNEMIFGPAIGIPLFATAIFLISFVIVMIISNIPLLKSIVP